MANTYTWTINALDVHPIQDTLTDVVYNVHWGITATSDQTDSEGNPYTINTIGTQIVGSPTPDQFIDFDSLTQDDVVSWLESSDMNIEEIKAGLDNTIQDLITPTSVTKNVPW
jgi:hypothetical protein